MLDRLARFVARHATFRVAALLSVLLTLSSLKVGLVMDDLTHRNMLAPDGPAFLARQPHELYRVMPDDDLHRAAAREAGWLPWHVDDNLLLDLWRPLTSLSLYLDISLWPKSHVLAHAHNIAWYVLLVMMVGVLFHRLIGDPKVAALATLLYAIDDAHGYPVGWIANRHALIAMTFGVAALLAHDRWRRDGAVAGAVLSPLLLAIGLWSGEMALTITAYLFAYALFVDQGSPFTRFASLVPAALVAIGWRVAYTALGYGAGGSGLHLDPLREPFRYITAIGERLPVLVVAQLTPVSADVSPIIAGGTGILLSLSTLLMVAAILLGLSGWLRHDRLASFWVIGMIVSAMPLSATLASDRMLLPTGIGAFGLVAQLLLRWGKVADDFWKHRSVRVIGGIFVLSHIILAPMLLPLRSVQPRSLQRPYTEAYRSLDRLGNLDGKTLVIVNAPNAFWSSMARANRHLLGLSVPERVQALGTGYGTVIVSRPEPNVLRLSSGAGFQQSFLDRLFRHPENALVPGDRVVLSDLTIEVAAVNPRGSPSDLICRFAGDLEDDKRVWATWRSSGYEPYELPEVGELDRIPAVDLDALNRFRYRR